MGMIRAFLAAPLLLCAGSLSAQELIGSYTAFIGTDDLYNSGGQRLAEPWQVLRQDRANYHRFGIAQPGDERDPFFGDIDNRAAMERMIMQGRIDPSARRSLMQGGARVVVRVYGRNDRGEHVEVTVAR